jgi:hypothetical protein
MICNRIQFFIRIFNPTINLFKINFTDFQTICGLQILTFKIIMYDNEFDYKKWTRVLLVIATIASVIFFALFVYRLICE